MASPSEEPPHRTVNNEIAEIAARLDQGEGSRYEFLCECADAECATAVMLTVAGYYETAKVGAVLADGHPQ
jgi:hypothetical protein